MILKLQNSCRYLVFSSAALLLAACSTTEPAKNSKQIPQNSDRNFLSQLGKSDIDRLADVEMRENTEILRTLMIKLYKRNPRELRKNTTASAEEMVKSVFENQHGWRFKEISETQGSDAIQQAFRPDYEGDRVMSLIVGLQTMLIKAHGGETEFYFNDIIDPQNIFNAARNVEIAVWQLSNKRDDQGQLFLLTNELNDHEHNLSFEREFGKIIGSLDLLAITLSEKLQRGITRIVQALSTAVFLPLGF